MPTTREASTPSRRAIRKAESKGTPVENDLQLKSSLPLPRFPRQGTCDPNIFFHRTVEWGLASNTSYAREIRSAPAGPALELAPGLPAIACAGAAVQRRSRRPARDGQARS